MQINVGPFNYQIQIHPGPIHHQGDDCCGLCDNINQIIYIADNLPHTQRLQVFFHELMHAWWYHFGLDANNEESIVDLIGMAMTDFMLQAAKSLKHQTSTTPHKNPPSHNRAESNSHSPSDSPSTPTSNSPHIDFLNFIEPGLKTSPTQNSLLQASLQLLGELKHKPTPQQQLPEIIQQIHDQETKTDTTENTPPPDTNRDTPGAEAKAKPHRTTHVYQPAHKLNPLTPIHAIRHGEWIVKIYDPEVEEEDFAA